MKLKKIQPWLFKILKTSIFLLSCYYIYQVISANIDSLNSIELTQVVALTTTICVILYVFFMMTLVVPWLSYLQFKKASPGAEIYLQSQAMKYLPGNVFHFAYRHTKNLHLGFKHKQLISATFTETFALTAVALILSGLLLFQTNQNDWFKHIQQLPDSLIIALQILLSASLIMWMKRVTKGVILWLDLFCYLLYFLGMGAILYLLVAGFQINPQSYFFLVAAYAAAWAAGYLVPGAPGGLGVREAAFILITQPSLVQAEAIMLIASVRLLSILGEVIMYTFSRQLSLCYHFLEAWSDKTKP